MLAMWQSETRKQRHRLSYDLLSWEMGSTTSNVPYKRMPATVVDRVIR